MLLLILHRFIFDLFYNKELIHYFISLDGEVVLAYCDIPRPESYSIHYDCSLRFIYQRLELMCSYIDTQ